MIGIGRVPECRVEAAVLDISTKIVHVHCTRDAWDLLTIAEVGGTMRALSQCWAAAILKEHMNATWQVRVGMAVTISSPIYT